MARIASIVGLDLSLTGAAMCEVPIARDANDWKRVRFDTAGYGLANGTQHEKVRRIVRVTGRVVQFVERAETNKRGVVVFIEGYAFSRHSSSVTKLAELGGAVRFALATELGIVAQEMTASRARTYLLGNLPRKNQKAIAQATVRSFCPLTLTGDEADAFVVANAGLAELGFAGLTVASNQ